MMYPLIDPDYTYYDDKSLYELLGDRIKSKSKEIIFTYTTQDSLFRKHLEDSFNKVEAVIFIEKVKSTEDWEAFIEFYRNRCKPKLAYIDSLYLRGVGTPMQVDSDEH